ncbi:MAG: DUF393 domain-containing protein [Rhodobacteraceae bacterium]|nr:DUF393 domain-containing protein [Paracoccaceae bacterium]
MNDKIDVIYNGACPICSREIAIYQRDAEASDAPVAWTDLTRNALPIDITAEEAAKRLHVVDGDQVLVGAPAFIAMWAAIPRWRWLARIVGAPGIRQIAGLIYDHILAPVLYAMHRRRQKRLLR